MEEGGKEEASVIEGERRLTEGEGSDWREDGEGSKLDERRGVGGEESKGVGKSKKCGVKGRKEEWVAEEERKST
ncbi:hypothetical protein Pmani_018175 [Petrolisthes manimaculis]|uniref:Uncharacterized protein n=1 Tax=Petrolisthes manimaculis TaxID=1843537 RepID=A0AAE1U8M3_9EUCA|nr:hypothetical protein Pmani_018175 [Petrolisthes manimaculis]